MGFLQRKSFQSVKDVGNSSSLGKVFSAFDLILLGLGAIVGTGVFALTGLVAAQYAGPAVTVSYAIAGLTCVLIALVYTELATMLPTSGSIYTYSYVALGELCAWLVVGIIMMSLGLGAAAVSGSWSAYVQGIISAAGYTLPKAIAFSPAEGGIINLPALLIVMFVGFMLYLGTKESKKLNGILVFIKMAAIMIFIIFAAPHFDATNWQNFMPYGFDNVLVGSSILFFAFTGFGVLASAAEECKNPERDLTIGIIGSLTLATLVYITVAAVLTGIVPYFDLNNAQPLAYALRQKGSAIGSLLVATGAVAGMTTVIMINIYGLSRIFYVVARDGLLPQSLTKLHHRYDSPYVIIILFTLIIGFIGALVPYGTIAQLASMAALADYTIVCIIVMLFRKQYRDVARPFKCRALFVVAPVAFVLSVYLLYKQAFDQGGNLLTPGRIFIYWMLAIFGMYFIIKKPSSNLGK